MITGRRVRLDVAINTSFGLIKLAALLYVIRLASAVYPAEVLGGFLLARRLASTLASLLQLGSSQTLLRYMPMAASAGARRRYLAVACALWVVVAAIALAALLPARSRVAAWAFPNSVDGPELASWAIASMVASMLGFLAYTTFLSQRQLVIANTIEFMSVSGFLLLPLMWLTEAPTPAALLCFSSVGVMILCSTALAGFFFVDRRPRPEAEPQPSWADVSRTFATYGFPRGGIAALDIGLITLGPWLLRGQPVQAGYLLVALTVVQTIQVALAPITQIASVVAADFVGRRELARLGQEARLLLGGTLYATALALAFIVPWSGYLLHLWLRDPELVAGVSYFFSWLAWGIVPVAFFHALRGIIEMRWFAPWNLTTLLLSTAVQILVYTVGRELLGEAAAVRAALLTTFWTLGVLTLAVLDVSWWRPLRYWGVGRLIGVAGTVALVNGLLAERSGMIEALLGVALSVAIVCVGLGLWASPPAVRAVRSFLWPRVGLEPPGRP
jgi:hypothetical protein